MEETQHDFPETSEERLKAVLSCMNGELKQATLLVVDQQPMTRSGIWKELADLTDAPLPDSRTFYDYCFQSLSPAGFLVQQTFGKGLTIRCHCFMLSPAGERYGQPLAAFSLKHAVDHKISLYDLLGPTSSAGDSRAPYNRARIVELLAEGADQIVDLKNQLKLDHTNINYHLTHLQRQGFLRFQSLNLEQGSKTYRWVKGRHPQEAQVVETRRTLTGAVARWLYTHKTGHPSQIAAAIRCRYKQDVSKVLVGLAQQGLAYTQFTSSSRSRVALRGRSRILLDYVKGVRAALSDPSELRPMAAILEDFRQDRRLYQQYLDAGVRLYHAASPMINAKMALERELELAKFLEMYQQKHRKGPRPSEIVRRLGWNHGTLRIYLNSLMHKGLIIKEQKKSSVRYLLRD